MMICSFPFTLELHLVMQLALICSVHPHGVSENATFVIDLDEVCFSDLRSDDLGSWNATGTKSTWFRLTNEGVRISVKKPPASELCNLYLLTCINLEYHVCMRDLHVHCLGILLT